VPGAKNNDVGFLSVEVLPLPKSQVHAVGLPVDRSENLTNKGEHPAVGLAVKLADGNCPITLAPRISEKMRVTVSLNRVEFGNGSIRF